MCVRIFVTLNLLRQSIVTPSGLGNPAMASLTGGWGKWWWDGGGVR